MTIFSTSLYNFYGEEKAIHGAGAELISLDADFARSTQDFSRLEMGLYDLDPPDYLMPHFEFGRERT